MCFRAMTPDVAGWPLRGAAGKGRRLDGAGPGLRVFDRARNSAGQQVGRSARSSRSRRARADRAPAEGPPRGVRPLAGSDETVVAGGVARPPRLRRYLELERLMLILDEEGESGADTLRDLMDPIWYSLSDEERRVLDERPTGR